MTLFKHNMAVFNKCKQGFEVWKNTLLFISLFFNSLHCSIQLLLAVIFTTHSSISVNYPVINNVNYNTSIIERGSKNVQNLWVLEHVDKLHSFYNNSNHLVLESFPPHYRHLKKMFWLCEVDGLRIIFRCVCLFVYASPCRLALGFSRMDWQGYELAL